MEESENGQSACCQRLKPYNNIKDKVLRMYFIQKRELKGNADVSKQKSPKTK